MSNRNCNQNISGGIDRFWLPGGLHISAKEQIDFLVRETPPYNDGALSDNFVIVASQSVAIPKDILINEQTPSYVLRGKTGWLRDTSAKQGWYVGYLEHGDRVYFFATNINIPRPEDSSARIGITKQILQNMRLLE